MFKRTAFLFLISLSCLYSDLTLKDDIKVSEDFTIQYLYDDQSTLTIDEISQQKFSNTLNSQFTLGYQKGTIWFKIILDNQSSNSDYILYFTEPFWTTFNLYKPTYKGWKEHKNGLSIPIQKRELQEANPAFPLDVPIGTSKTYYVKGQTINGQIGAFELFTASEYFRPNRISIITFYQFYTAILIIIILLNLFLLVQMRERINLYYIGYVISYIIFISMFSGSYLYFGLAPWPEGLHTIGAVVLIFMALFSSEFLQVKKYFPNKKIIFSIYISSFITLGFLMSLNTAYVTLIFNIFAFSFMILLLILAIKTWKMGKIKTNYYLSSLIIYMPTMGLMALTFDGFISNTDFTRYAFLFGAMIELIFFSLILARNFHVAKYDQIRLQAALLKQKETNEKLLEDEIQRQQEMLEERNAMMLQQSRHAQMGEMIAMIAHQWRQPLASISAVTGSLEMSIVLGDYNESDFKDNLKKVSDYTQHLSKTIENFREFFKEDKKESTSSLQEICETSIDIMAPTLTTHKIALSTDYQSHSEFSTYPHEINQVLLNLLKNAQEVFEEKKLADAKIAVRSYERDNKFYIEVEDNGGGIPEDIIDKIFDPYFTTKEELNGTGLGLYMSKKIITEHCKGTLSVKNHHDGALFIIQI